MASGGLPGLMSFDYIPEESTAESKVNESGLTPLLQAASNGQPTDLKRILAGSRVDVNQTVDLPHYDVAAGVDSDHRGRTALMFAASRTDGSKIAELLLESPAIDVNMVDKMGRTALMIAAGDGNLKTVEILLRHSDIDVEIIDSEGKTALVHAVIGMSVVGGHKECAVIIGQRLAAHHTRFSSFKDTKDVWFWIFMEYIMETTPRSLLDELSRHFSGSKDLIRLRSKVCHIAFLGNASESFSLYTACEMLESLRMVDGQVWYTLEEDTEYSLAPHQYYYFTDDSTDTDLSRSMSMANVDGKIRLSWGGSLKLNFRSFLKVGQYLLGMLRDNVQNKKYRILVSPISFVVERRFLRMCIKLSNLLSRPQVFDGEVVAFAVDAAWHSYGRVTHLWNMATYVVLLIGVSIVNYSFNDSAATDDAPRVGQLFAWFIVVFILVSYFLLLECIQLVRMMIYRETLKYFTDYQNYLDMTAYVLTLIVFRIRMERNHETILSRALMPVATLLLWAKLLYYLRPFQGTGTLVRMVFYIMYSIKELLLIILIVIVGFSQAFYQISFHDPTLNFSSPTQGMVNMFAALMGQSNFEDARKMSDPELGVTLLCLFLLVGPILLLNLLIALMNNAYSAIQENADAEWRRERAELLLEQFSIFHWRGPKWHIRVMDEEDYKNYKNDQEERELKAKGSSVNQQLAVLERSNQELKVELAETKKTLGELKKDCAKLEQVEKDQKEILRQLQRLSAAAEQGWMSGVFNRGAGTP